MERDELAARRRAKQARRPEPAETVEPTIEELGRRAAEAFLASQRAVALGESEAKLELLWRDVERWTDDYIAAIRRAAMPES